jgi:hypothetical protein
MCDLPNPGDLLVDLARYLRDGGFGKENAKKAPEAELNRLITAGIAKGDAAYFKKAGKMLEAAERGKMCNSRDELEAYCAEHPVRNVTDKMNKAIICMATLQRDPDTDTITYSSQPCYTAFTFFDGKGSASYARHIQEWHLKCPKAETRNGRKRG